MLRTQNFEVLAFRMLGVGAERLLPLFDASGRTVPHERQE